MMPKIFLVPAALIFASGVAAANLQPMSATYSVMRDGKTIGDANYSLAANADGTWTLHSQTRGSAGMARLLGLDVREESTFRWTDGKPQGLHYDYKQDAAIKSKRREIDFDWNSRQAHVRDSLGEPGAPARVASMILEMVGPAASRAAR
jgi:hypothetical protein